MARHKLIPYELQVREMQQTVEYTDLLNILYNNRIEDEFQGNLSNAPQTFIELFEEYGEAWRSRQGAHVDQDLQKTLRMSQRDGEFEIDYSNNIVEGVFKYGEFGQVIDTYDTDTGQTDTQRLDSQESADTPFYFLLHVPEEEPEEAIVVLEESDNRGIKLRFQDALQSKLPDGVAQEMSRVKDEEVYETIRSANRVKRLVVETTESPHELGGKFDSTFEPTSTAKQMTYSPPEGNSIPINVNELMDWVENEDNPFTNVAGETYTKFKLTVERAGSQTTIDFFQDGVNLARTLEGVEREGGHPVPGYMGSEARQFVNQELLPEGADPIPTDSLLRS